MFLTGANGEVDVTSQLPDPPNAGRTLITGVTSPITKIRLASQNANANAIIRMLYADGTAVVDHSSIGVDMSGNGNHFHDQNFALK